MSQPIETIMEEAKAFLLAPVQSIAEAKRHIKAFIAHHEGEPPAGANSNPESPSPVAPSAEYEEVSEHAEEQAVS